MYEGLKTAQQVAHDCKLPRFKQLCLYSEDACGNRKLLMFTAAAVSLIGIIYIP